MSQARAEANPNKVEEGCAISMKTLFSTCARMNDLYAEEAGNGFGALLVLMIERLCHQQMRRTPETCIPWTCL